MVVVHATGIGERRSTQAQEKAARGTIGEVEAGGLAQQAEVGWPLDSGAEAGCGRQAGCTIIG